MTILPAQRLETYVPAMKNKGRIKKVQMLTLLFLMRRR